MAFQRDRSHRLVCTKLLLPVSSMCSALQLRRIINGPPFWAPVFHCKFCQILRHCYPQICYVPQPLGVDALTDNTSRLLAVEYRVFRDNSAAEFCGISQTALSILPKNGNLGCRVMSVMLAHTITVESMCSLPNDD